MAEHSGNNLNENQKKSLKKPSGWNEFYQAVAPDIVSRLGEEYELRTISKVASRMWKQLGTERKKDWRNEAQRKREEWDTGLVELEQKCKKCDKCFLRQRDLRYHAKGCGKILCNDCGQEFLHKEYLKSHIIKEHQQTFKCDECGKAFHSKRNLKRHQVTHTNAKVTCEVCGSHINSTSLKRHMKLKHSYGGFQQQYLCSAND